MPRPSFSDNPLLRVSRPVSACSRCRAAKVKCDGKLPACTACEKAGRESECSAANDQFARGKERSYVAALELRVEKLERRLAYARSRKASVAMHEQEAPLMGEHDRKDSLATIRAAIHRKAARKRENSDVNSLVSDFGFLSVNATTRDFEPSVSNMTFARLVLAATMNTPVPEPKMTSLPSRQAAYGIVQYYMANIYTLFPAFSETVLLTALDDLYQPDQRPIKSVDRWLLYMVLAIGSIAQSRSNQDDFYANGVEFVSHALEVADRALMPGYITQIQSLLLLTQYSMLDPAHFDSWHLIGFTCRAVVDLGLHQDPPAEQLADKGVLDMRRKIFYCVYSLDRSISMIYARPFSFTDDSINVAFPSMSGLSRIASNSGPITGPQSADPAVLLFQLRRAQSHWYQELFQSDPSEALPDGSSFVWQMCHEMREWAEALPDILPTGIRELFDLELRYSYVYCVARNNRAHHMTAYGRMLTFEHAIAYVDRIFEVATRGPLNTAFYTYHDALRVFFMGNQFLGVLRESGDAFLAGASVPVPLTLPGKAPPPPMPSRRVDDGDNLDRSLRCLERVTATLEKYGERWADAVQLGEGFRDFSSNVLQDLRARRSRRDAAYQQQRQQQQHMQQHAGPSAMQQQHQHHHQQQVQQMQHQQAHAQQSQASMQAMGSRMPPSHQQQQTHPRDGGQSAGVTWIDVDISRMMGGNGGGV